MPSLVGAVFRCGGRVDGLEHRKRLDDRGQGCSVKGIHGLDRSGSMRSTHQERQGSGPAVNASQWHYPMSEMRAALQRLAANSASAGGIILEYTNRSTGGPVMPTIDCHMQLLRPGEKTQVRRSVCCTNYHVVEGAGCSIVGDQRLDWEDKDVFTVPTWTFCEHVNSGDRPAFLFSFSDAPVMKALSLYRDETRS